MVCFLWYLATGSTYWKCGCTFNSGGFRTNHGNNYDYQNGWQSRKNTISKVIKTTSITT